jgi:cysteine-rich repeat protein
VGVELAFSYIRLWGAAPADPWTATDTIDALDEVQAYWLNPSNNMDAIAGSHDIVHFISGKDVQGGVAYVGAICNRSYGFGVSQVNGTFNLADPSTVWDVLVFTHEVGHNFGSPHTHCYNPPIDRCYTVEPNCYNGPVVTSRGTIMSYCHLLGGVQNVDLIFGGTVSNQITSTIATVSCLETVQSGTCGNAVVEAGEECDDGGVVAGDGCSAGCRLEVCGNAWKDPGEDCDDGNTVTGDALLPHLPARASLRRRGPRCGGGVRRRQRVERRRLLGCLRDGALPRAPRRPVGVGEGAGERQEAGHQPGRGSASAARSVSRFPWNHWGWERAALRLMLEEPRRRPPRGPDAAPRAGCGWSVRANGSTAILPARAAASARSSSGTARGVACPTCR